MALITMTNIRKDYHLGETIVHALRGIDLSIDRAEFIAVWGPSGSGKTTLLNLVGAIDEPTEGNITIDGTDVLTLSDNRRSELRCGTIGFIFQSFNLVPVLSALGERYAAAPDQWGIRQGSAGEGPGPPRRSGPRRVRPSPPLQDVGGQQQRVSIARALANGPSLVIADEPTANLDSETARMIIDLMRTLNEKDGITFLFSTHDQRLLDRVGRLVRLEDGRIVDGGARS